MIFTGQGDMLRLCSCYAMLCCSISRYHNCTARSRACLLNCYLVPATLLIPFPSWEGDLSMFSRCLNHTRRSIPIDQRLDLRVWLVAEQVWPWSIFLELIIWTLKSFSISLTRVFHIPGRHPIRQCRFSEETSSILGSHSEEEIRIETAPSRRVGRKLNTLQVQWRTLPQSGKGPAHAKGEERNTACICIQYRHGWGLHMNTCALEIPDGWMAAGFHSH